MNEENQSPKRPRKQHKVRSDKKLPAPRTRYYVGEPVLVIPLAEYEQLTNHLTSMTLLDRLTQNEQQAVSENNRLFLRQLRDRLKKARQYYQITHSKEK
ncbi:hypothetical protein [Spirosoma sp.]|uniref:hypothetical protein n=1 Tax=Spirosoma sp. TaxID=1899569 RepID=UPI00262CACC1|nr:hypothetical protein [Spirosoma sp.]MCX6217613.1 hypothetical protein [Spirosoma sp.]